MKAYIITVKGNYLSEQSAKKTFDSAKWAGLEPEIVAGVDKFGATNELKKNGLKINNTDGMFTKLSYKEATIGCFLSHYNLWKKSLYENKPILILEHDVKFLSKFDYELPKDYDGIINIGKPLWGHKWKSWIDGVYHRTCKVPMTSFLDEHKYCDCEEHFLHGAHAYIVTPNAAKKLISHYKENGIIPADFSINTEVVDIRDFVPHCCEQVREFSLVQRNHHAQGFTDDFIYGDAAWSNDENRWFKVGKEPSDKISIIDLTEVVDDESRYKKVMVFICDGNLLDKVKPLIHNAKTTGKWDGDFVLMVPSEVDTSQFDEDKDNDLIIYKVPDLLGGTIHFHKIFLFEDFFHEWDWVFYSDLDVWYTDEIKLDLLNKQYDKLYVPEDRLSFDKQFDFRKLDETSTRLVQKSTPQSGESFQTCWMLFCTRDRKWIKYYKTRLINFYFRYHVYGNISKVDYWEQSIFNLVFAKDWKKIGCGLVQSKAIHMVWDGKLTLDDLKRGYDDRTDYSDSSGIHFTFPFAPWFKYNRRFYREWEKVNNEI